MARSEEQTNNHLKEDKNTKLENGVSHHLHCKKGKQEAETHYDNELGWPHKNGSGEPRKPGAEPKKLTPVGAILKHFKLHPLTITWHNGGTRNPSRIGRFVTKNSHRAHCSVAW